MIAIELDHFFILTEPGSPQADLMSSIALIEGARNTHSGQGTANRRFFFANSTLEFLYVCDASEANSGPGRRLRLAERAVNDNASPFGLIVRSSTGSTDDPFPGWKYCPDYFNEGQCFQVGENSDLLEEPLCICMPTNLPQRKNKPVPENPGWRLTELRISVPVHEPSLALAEVAKCEGVSLRLNEPHRLELVFNEGKAGKSNDMTTDLPLIIHW